MTTSVIVAVARTPIGKLMGSLKDFSASDLDTLSSQLREQDVRLVYEAPRRGTANSRINFIHPKDAGGVLIELVEPAS